MKPVYTITLYVEYSRLTKSHFVRKRIEQLWSGMKFTQQTVT